MRKWSKKHKNYKQLQVTGKEFGGQGITGFCFPHSLLANFLLSNWNDGLKSEWLVRKEVETPPTPYTCISKFISCSHWARCVAYQNW